MKAKKSNDTQPLLIMEDTKKENNNVPSSPNNQIATRVNMPQRPMETNMIFGHVNEVFFNLRQPLTEDPDSTKYRMGKRTSFQSSSNAPHNNMRSVERMSYRPSIYSFKNRFRNNFGRDYNPIDRPCDVIFEEDRENAEYYNNLDEIIVSRAGNAPKCYETWRDANFHPTLQNTITKSGYTKPRRIEAFTIPIIANGFDLICQSEAASEKTGAYLLPIIDEMLKSEWKSKNEPKTPYAMIIAPTRTKLCCATLYGQKTKDFFKANLDSGCDILIPTPGRLNEFLSEQNVHLNKLRYVVLDEADGLKKNNFAKEVTNILQSPLCAPLAARQNLLFSATFPQEPQEYFREWVKDNAITIRNDKSNPVNKNIILTFIRVEGMCKNKVCADVIIAENKEAKKHGMSFRKTLVFVGKKRTSNVLALF
uniref:Helicase ATP-binding domain-containing protein n=2 Tax=Strongyloides papillosus TaxID=174720 RepID=A0A0N5BEH3_STREA